MTEVTDPHNLTRFLEGQKRFYDIALNELKIGEKREHWMWFTFPQFHGLGWSPTSKHYSIKSLAEAKEYLAHPLLGPRLIECCEALLSHEIQSAASILGTEDSRKLLSCATLFAYISPPDSVFHQVLDKFFESRVDRKTLQLITLPLQQPNC